MATTYVTGASGFDANTPLYNALVNKVYDWANRDIDALPPQIVRDSLRYAADTAYRTLRVPPLEKTVRWTNFPGTLTITDTSTEPATVTTMAIANITELETARSNLTDTQTSSYVGPLDTASVGTGNVYQSVTPLAIPNDLIEFIHIRGADLNGLTTRVFNEKADIRSFWDICNDHYNIAAFWSRQKNNVLLTPSFGNAARGFYGGGSGPEFQLEMYYYGRLPALNATFDQTYVNWMGGNGTLTIDGTVTAYTNQTEAEYNALIAAPAVVTWVGMEVPHWLRDENEKVPLMGALGECFAYLQEDDQSQKYFNLFTKEIADLNDEDRMRDASGGNIQTQYTAYGLI